MSTTTVSHAISGRGRVSEKTREKVLKTVEALRYRSNPHAQQLVTRRSRILAIQLPFTGQRKARFPHSGYYLELMNGATTAADELGYAMIVIPAAGAAAGRSWAGFAVDGALLVDPVGDEPVFDLPVPVATIAKPVKPSRPVVSVDNDHRATVQKVLRHFERRGSELPALVADRTSRSYVKDLVDAFVTLTEKRGQPAVVHRLGTVDRHALDRAVAAIRDQGADAVLATSDDIAIGLHDAARRLGSPVPEHFLLASAVDAPSLKLTSPQITGMDLYPRRAGDAAVRLLVEQIEGPVPGASERTVEVIRTRLVHRGSS